MISLIEHTNSNAASYVQMGGDRLIKHKLDELYTEIIQRKNAQMYYTEADGTLKAAGAWIAFIGNSVAIGINLVSGYMSSTVVTSVVWMSQDFSTAMLWGSKNAGTISQNAAALNRLKDLQRMFIAASEKMTISDVTLKYGYTDDGSSWPHICFRNFSVSVLNQTIVHADSVCSVGRINAISGPSGCGKTSLFKVVSGFPDAAISGLGTIQFYTKDGTPPSIAMISQHRYLPPGFKLIEHITEKLGDSTNEPYKATIEERLAEIGSADLIPNLYTVDHWDGRLSGGQYQKIRIVGLTLEENSTGLMLLDEAFVGLDLDSQTKAKHMLLKYLPHWTLVIIDHGAICGDEFYDSRLDFKAQENGARSLISDRCVHEEWVRFDYKQSSAVRLGIIPTTINRTANNLAQSALSIPENLIGEFHYGSADFNGDKSVRSFVPDRCILGKWICPDIGYLNMTECNPVTIGVSQHSHDYTSIYP